MTDTVQTTVATDETTTEEKTPRQYGMNKIELSLTERLILSNQYQILQKLDKENNEIYNSNIEILKNGYTIEYDELFADITKNCISTEDQYFVFDVLCMYHDLEYYERMNNLSKSTFYGFDGNNEGSLKHYCEFILLKQNCYDNVKNTKNYYNSHWPTKEKYEKMLSIYKTIDRSFFVKEKIHSEYLKEKMTDLLKIV